MSLAVGTSNGAATRPESKHDQSVTGLLTGALAVGIPVVNQARSWGVDRSRVLVAASQQMGHNPVKWGMLVAGAGVGLPLALRGLGELNVMTREGRWSDLAQPDQGGTAIGQLALGAGAIALGTHLAMPDGKYGLRAVADLFRGPTTKTVPIDHGIWQKLANSSNGISQVMLGATMLSVGLSLHEGYEQEGFSGIIGTKSGRDGVAMGAQMALGGVVMAMAANRNKVDELGHAVEGGFFKRARTSPWLSFEGPKTARYAVGMGLGFLWLLNQGGYFKGLDANPS